MAKGKDIRRSFSREFKLEAVRRFEQRPEGVSTAHVGRELGVRPDMLRAWAKQLAGQARSGPSKPRSEEEEELRRLRRENARLQQENEFLKKAAAYFAREER